MYVSIRMDGARADASGSEKALLFTLPTVNDRSKHPRMKERGCRSPSPWFDKERVCRQKRNGYSIFVLIQ